MRKIFIMTLFLALTAVGLAQEPKKIIEVGPYNLLIYDMDNYEIKEREGADPNDYFKMKKDTVVVYKNTEPMTRAWQVNASFAMPRFVANGMYNVFGLDGSWKKNIGGTTWFNAGVLVALSVGKFLPPWVNNPRWDDDEINESIFEVGVPLSIEWTRLDRKKASLYFGVGFTPTFYFGAKGKMMTDENTNDEIWTENNQSGLFIAPRVDIGGYIPVGKQLIRVGLFGQYDINCTTKDGDVFAERLGRFFVGGNIGIVF